MRINKLKIRNFKGFENEEITFNGNLTVAIGNNTSGKTTMLHAIQIGLGAYLQSLKSLRGGKAFRRNFTESDRFLRYSQKKKDYFPNSDSTRIDIEAEFVDTIRSSDGRFEFTSRPVHWYREFTKAGSTTHNRICAGDLINAVSELERKREEPDNNAVLPIVLSFGTNRIEAQMRTSRKVQERQQRIEKAYKAALLDQIDFSSAMEWLKRYDKNIRDGKEFEGTRDAFYNALQTAIPALSEIDIDNGEIEAVVTVEGKHPARHHYSFMSDGLKSMISIVSEISYRCIELNGFLGKDAVVNTPGIVLIDEVDLYLHPKWQQHILRDLQEAFPNIQFIVTTHSPFIVQSLKEGQLWSFDDGVVTDGMPYKEGLEDIASERMGMENEIRSKRFNEMVEIATEYFKESDAHNSEKAKDLREKLKLIESEFSDDPAYVAMIKMEYKSKTAK